MKLCQIETAVQQLVTVGVKLEPCVLRGIWHWLRNLRLKR